MRGSRPTAEYITRCTPSEFWGTREACTPWGALPAALRSTEPAYALRATNARLASARTRNPSTVAAYAPPHDQAMIGAVYDQRSSPNRFAHFRVSGGIVVRICGAGNEERRPSLACDTVAYVVEPEQRRHPDGLNIRWNGISPIVDRKIVPRDFALNVTFDGEVSARISTTRSETKASNSRASAGSRPRGRSWGRERP